jgi:hypothetical protein
MAEVLTAEPKVAGAPVASETIHDGTHRSMSDDKTDIEKTDSTELYHERVNNAASDADSHAYTL